MHIYVLLLIMPLMAQYRGVSSDEPRLSGLWLLVVAVGPYLVLAAAAYTACRTTIAAMNRAGSGAGRMIRRLDRLITLARWAGLGVFYFSVFGLGYPVWLRQTLGDWMLLNDLLVLVPPLGLVVFIWWAHYPIDRRLREATLLHQLDSGGPVYAIWTRGQYVLAQVRHQVLLVLVPMIGLLIWVQVVDRWMMINETMAPYHALLMLAGGAAVFTIAPLMIRHVWDTIPMPAGELRQHLTQMCRQYKVRVSELLLWRTYGGLVNGAVMGLVGPLRYILLTDGLIEQLRREQVEAVMAHELGHVRRHHIPWMVICASACLGAVGIAAECALFVADWVLTDVLHVGDGVWMQVGPGTASVGGIGVLDGAVLVGVVAGWGMLFGVVSRRFERQADTFAVQHLARQKAESAGADDPRAAVIDYEAAETFAGALRRVAELNHAPLGRRSWRHGSINWRIAYLHSLVGRRINDCPIDRQVVVMRSVCGLVLAAVIVVVWRLAPGALG